MARHDLEQVATAEVLFRAFHTGRVFAGLMIALPFRAGRGLKFRCGAVPLESARGFSVMFAARRTADEFVVVGPGVFQAMVGHEDPVRQIEHEIAVVGTSLLMPFDVLELESQVVAESAVESEKRILGAAEPVHQRAQCGEHAMLAAAVFFAEAGLGLAYICMNCRLLPAEFAHRLAAGQGPFDFGKQDRAAAIERFYSQLAAAPGQAQGRIDKADVPARVASRIFEAGPQQHAGRAIERIDKFVHRRRVIIEFFDRQMYANAAAGLVPVLSARLQSCVSILAHHGFLRLACRSRDWNDYWKETERPPQLRAAGEELLRILPAARVGKPEVKAHAVHGRQSCSHRPQLSTRERIQCACIPETALCC